MLERESIEIFIVIRRPFPVSKIRWGFSFAKHRLAQEPSPMVIMVRWPHYARTCGECIAPYAPDDNQCFNEDFVVVINRKSSENSTSSGKEGIDI